MMKKSDLTAGLLRMAIEKLRGDSTWRSMTDGMWQIMGSYLARQLDGYDDKLPFVGGYVGGSNWWIRVPAAGLITAFLQSMNKSSGNGSRSEKLIAGMFADFIAKEVLIPNMGNGINSDLIPGSYNGAPLVPYYLARPGLNPAQVGAPDNSNL